MGIEERLKDMKINDYKILHNGEEPSEYIQTLMDSYVQYLAAFHYALSIKSTKRLLEYIQQGEEHGQ